MSFSMDVNILLYASDVSSVHHDAARSFLGSTVTGDEACYLTWVTLMSYLRMATHPRIFDAPLSPREAECNVDQLLSSPHIHCISEGPDFWSRYRAMAGEIPIRGNLVPDAHLAALLQEHGIRTLYTHDRDFRKFSFLRVVDPFASEIS